MKEYKGNLITDDIYYLLLSFNDKTNWEWFEQHNLVTYNGHDRILPNILSKDELMNLILSAIKYNVEQIKCYDELSLIDIENYFSKKL